MTLASNEVVQEWADAVNSGAALSEALGMTPCQTLYALFPAIVGDDDVMGALAEMLDPVVPFLAHLEHTGAVAEGEGAMIAHDLFHLLQIAAGLGHMLGVNEGVTLGREVPSLDSVEWDAIPDMFRDLLGDDDTTPEGSGPEES